MNRKLNPLNGQKETGISTVSSFLLKGRILQALFLILTLIFFVLPVMKLVYMSFQGESGWTLDHYQEILSSDRTWNVLKNTLVMVVGSSIIASLFGVIFAWIIAFSDIRHKQIIQLGVFLPFIIPSYVSSLAWVQFFGKNGQLEKLMRQFFEDFQAFNLYSMAGIIIVMGLTTYPLVYLFTLNAFRQIPRESELAARISGASRWETFLKVTLPMALPGLAGGIFVAFLNSLDNFGIPAFLGSSANITVLTTYIYQQVIGFGPNAFNQAAVLSVILGLIALLGLLIQWIILAKSQRLESQVNDLEPRFHLGRMRPFLEVAVFIFFLLTSILPLGSLIISPLYKVLGKPLSLDNISFKNYRFILESSNTQDAILVSMKLALITALLALVIGTLFAYYRVRKPNQANQFIESAVTIPYALPGTVFALSMIFAWMQPIPGWNPGIYGSIWILYIAYFTRFFSLQVRSSIASFQQLDVSIEEASQVSGANGWHKWQKILVPLILPTVIGGTFLVFLTALTELTVSSLLYSSKSKTIGVSILSFQQAGNMRHATAFSSLIVILILLGYLAWSLIKFINRRKEGQ